MTLITGNIKDIGLDPLSGTLIATSVEFRVTGDIIIAPESRTYPIAGGIVSADLIPGPTRLTIQVGSHARDSFDVIVPDEPVTLARLIEDAFEWSPAVVSEVAAHRAAAEAAAARAEDAAGDVDSAIAGAADQVVAAVEQDRVAAEQAASDAAGSASSASGSASAAAGSESAAATSAAVAGTQATLAGERAGDAGVARDAAAGSAAAAAGSASDAAGSASDAAGSATDAEAARAAAVVARTGAESARSGAEDARDAADGHATRAETAANSFDLTATATTGAPGSNATVAVTGDGPAYGLSFTVPRGAKGEQGDAGPQGLAGTQEIGWTDDGTPYLLEPGTGEPATQSGDIVAAGRPDISATMDAATQDAVNAAATGAMFRSTDGPQGAWAWRKLANGQWSVVDGDTGWRNVISTLESNGATGVSGRLRLKRTAGLVWVSADDLQAASGTVVLIPELSFQIDADNATYPGALYNLVGDKMQRLDTARLRFSVAASGCRLRDLRSYPNTKPWPTTLPGTPA